MHTLNAAENHQKYWSHTAPFWSKVNKNLLVAPLIHKRHNKELRLSSATGIGTLPSRLHTVFLSFYILSNVLYCCLLDYQNQPRPVLLAGVRGRTGHLAVMNMIPLFIFSTRNNPLIPILGVSFDTFNLFHRWIGRITAVQSLAHTFCWGANNYDALGLKGLSEHLWGDWFLVYGLIATIAFVLIIILSMSFLRHAFYESFLHGHQVLAIIALAGILLHVNRQKLPQNHTCTKLQVQALEGGACRLTFEVQGAWPREPGRHIYAYIPSVSLWMSHPFSVAWVDRNATWIPNFSIAETLTVAPSKESEDLKPLSKTSHVSVSCVVASRSGMTSALCRKAKGSPSGIISLSAFVEGPYGSGGNLRSYGTVILFAGGVGITHQVSHMRDIVGAFADGTCATRKVVLIWSVRSVEQLDWAKPFMDELLEMPTRGNTLKILLYVSRPNRDIQDLAREKEAGDHHRVSFGRMHVGRVLICGPGALADDIRAAARAVMDQGNVGFWEEAFTW
ncbi:ferric reductase like transmembrane component-domain-containing protein [Bisporella sp. PMI_857]|nr:ferric reductase like transmembrane component-domain-containing protein [Bisporella sp. PMI_857]